MFRALGGKGEGGYECVGVCFFPVDFYGGADGGVGEDEVGEGGGVEEGAVDVEELAEEGFGAVEVDCGVEVEPFEVDVDDVEVLKRREVG